ncbi:MAG: ABC transporter substrate-binding protein [Phycisphaerales bacterium]
MPRVRGSVLLACVALVLGACDRTPRDATAPTGGTPAQATPKPLVVGFSQIGAEGAWRTANSESIRGEAGARGIRLVFSDAQQKQENQIKALRSFIAQDVDVIVLAPVIETGWEPVLREVKAAGIPVILTDRSVQVSDESLFVTFIGADFVDEGRRAADWLIKASNGSAVIAELQGTPGSAPAIDRKKGFGEAIAPHAGMRIVLSQSGDFNRAKGKEVMEALLKTPEGRAITAVYAHNDDMALGAIQAIEESGRRPGRDVLMVSIDAVRGAFEAMAAGTLNCTVECTPLIGPLVFDTVQAVAEGRTVPRRIPTPGAVYEQPQAAELLPGRKY